MIAGTNEHDTIEYDMTSFSQYPQCQGSLHLLHGFSYRKPAELHS